MSKGMRTLVKMRFRQELFSPRVLAGYSLGFFIAFFYGRSYAGYAGEMPAGAGEAFVLLLNPFLQLSFVMLGYLLIISRLPLVDSLTLFTLIRSGRRSWVRSVLLYLFGQTLLYYTVVFMGTLLPMAGVGVLRNEWSQIMVYLSRFRPADALENYGISPLGINVLEAWTPAWAVLHCFLLICCYSVVLALIMFAGNLNSDYPIGSFLAVTVHFVGTVLIKTGGKILLTISPLANAVLGMHLDENGNSSLSSSYLLFFVELAALTALLFYLSKKADFVSSNGDRVW